MPRHCRPCAGSEHARSDHPAEMLCSHAGGFRQGRSDTSRRTGSANLQLRGAAVAGHPQPRPGQNRLQPAGRSDLLLIIPESEDAPLGEAARQHWESMTGQCFDRGYRTVQRPLRRPHLQPRQHQGAGGALRRTQRTTPCHCQHLFPPRPHPWHAAPHTRLAGRHRGVARCGDDQADTPCPSQVPMAAASRLQLLKSKTQRATISLLQG